MVINFRKQQGRHAVIEQVQSYKYLGTVIDENLTLIKTASLSAKRAITASGNLNISTLTEQS